VEGGRFMRRVEIVMILGSVGLLLVVLELVRRRRLKEEYSLLWLLTAVVLLALSLWSSSLDWIAKIVGIFYPPTALFVVGFGFVLLLLLYFSTIISKLSGENNNLTQQIAILDWRVQQLEEQINEPISQFDRNQKM
jgi:hypothetical protein